MPHGISGTFGKTVSFSEIKHFPEFLGTSYGGQQLSRQSLFTHGKIDINFATAKSISPGQNQFLHGKVIFTHGKIGFTTAKSFWLTCLRDPVSSQSAMGINPTWRSSSWFHDSTCIAQIVEIVCLQCGQVSRNWLMDVYKYTVHLPFYSATDSQAWNPMATVSSRIHRIPMKGLFIAYKLLLNLC